MPKNQHLHTAFLPYFVLHEQGDVPSRWTGSLIVAVYLIILSFFLKYIIQSQGDQNIKVSERFSLIACCAYSWPM
jgi:hypothetical protein